MKNNMPLFAITLLCLAGTLAYSGDLTTGNLTVNNDATIYGKLQMSKTVGSAPTNGLVLYYSFDTTLCRFPMIAETATLERCTVQLGQHVVPT